MKGLNELKIKEDNIFMYYAKKENIVNKCIRIENTG